MTPSRWMRGRRPMATDPPAADLGAIRPNLEVFLEQLATWREMEAGWIRALLTEYDAQAARLAHMGTYCAYCTAEFPDEAPDTIQQIQRHVYVCAYHPMREVERDRDAMDSAATHCRVALEAQAARLAAVDQLMQEADITCSCCQSWVETLQAAIHAGAVGAGGSVDHPGKEEHQEDDQEQG